MELPPPPKTKMDSLLINKEYFDNKLRRDIARDKMRSRLRPGSIHPRVASPVDLIAPRWLSKPDYRRPRPLPNTQTTINLEDPLGEDLLLMKYLEGKALSPMNIARMKSVPLGSIIRRQPGSEISLSSPPRPFEPPRGGGRIRRSRRNKKRTKVICRNKTRQRKLSRNKK